MKTLVWTLLVILLALFSASGHDIFIRQPDSEDDDHQSILEQLRDRFVGFRERVQYGVLYVAPPDAVGRQIMFEPDSPSNSPPAGVLYPEIDPNAPSEIFQHNFAVANIDFNGRVYGQLLRIPRGRTIHTERLFVDLVYPRMHRWYTDYYGVLHPNLIYIFTHHLPCEFCDTWIRRLQSSNPEARIFVGYTDLYLNREATDEALRNAAQTRRDSLNNFLYDNTGRLFLLPNNQGVCEQEGQSASMFRTELKKTVSSNTCPAASKNREFIITMDLSTGKAVVVFSGIPANYYGWIGLYSSKTSQSYLTYEWTNEETSGRKVFDEYLSDGMQVRYFNGKSTTNLAITSYSWQQCGYDWMTLEALPHMRLHGLAELKLKITNGKISVGFRSNEYTPNSRDWIAIQSINQLGSRNYWTWQWISSFEGTHERWWNSGYRPDGDLSEGFRAKYIYATTEGEYEWEDIYDNATPFWTNNCRGTA